MLLVIWLFFVYFVHRDKTYQGDFLYRFIDRLSTVPAPYVVACTSHAHLSHLTSDKVVGQVGNSL